MVKLPIHLKHSKLQNKQGLEQLSICNVDNSSIVRLSDASILTRAGTEKGVASTKAFATQVAVLWMLSLYVAQYKKSITTKELQDELNTLREVSNASVVKDAIHEKNKTTCKAIFAWSWVFLHRARCILPISA